MENRKDRKGQKLAIRERIGTGKWVQWETRVVRKHEGLTSDFRHLLKSWEYWCGWNLSAIEVEAGVSPELAS